MDPDSKLTSLEEAQIEQQALLPLANSQNGQHGTQQTTDKDEDIRINTTPDGGNPWIECRKQLLGVELLRSIKDGNISEVHRRLKQGASPNTCCAKTRISSLHLAVALHLERVVTLLLENEAHVRLRDGKGRQPIHIAAALGDLHLLQKFLDHDPSLLNSTVSLETIDGEEISDCVHVELVDFSIDDIFAQVPDVIDGSTLLHIAVENLHRKCVEELIKRGAAKDLMNSRAITPIHSVGRHGRKGQNFRTSPKPSKYDSWANEIDDVPDSSESSLFPLDYSKSGSETIRNDTKETLKSYSTDALDMLKWLVAQGGDYFIDELNKNERIDYMETTCLHNAIKNNDVALIEYVIEQFGSEVLLVRNKEGQTGLHLAIAAGEWQLVELLLATNMIEENKMKQVVNGRDRMGRTPLHLAARAGNVPDVSLLLSKGANVSAIAADGSNVLHYAAENPNPEVLEDLLTKCTDCKELINAEDNDCLTPICIAVEKGLLHNACVLVEHGADVTHKRPGIKPWKEYLEFLKSLDQITRQRLCGEEEWIEPRNVTLLHLAALKGHASILQLLLKDPRIDKTFRALSWRGNTALHFAVMKGSTECVEVLLKYGFQVNRENLKGQTPFCLAVAMNRNDLLQLFIAHNPSDVASQARLASFLAAFYGYQECLKTIISSYLSKPDSSSTDLKLVDIPWSQLKFNDDDHLNFLKTLLDEGCEVSDHSFEDPECRIKLNYGYFNSLSSLQILKNIINVHGDDELENMLSHPFVETFLHVKWKSLRYLVLFYIKVYIIFVTLLTTVGTLHYFVQSSSPMFTVTMHFLGILTHVVKTWQDLSQLRRMKVLGLWEEYWKSKETWLTWATDCLSLLVLLGPHPAPWLQYVSAVTVLLSWLEVLSVLSCWPSKIGFNIHMFFTVSKNMIKVLLPFTVAFLGFMFAFLICRPRHPFDNMWSALVKVMSMTVDFDYYTMSSSLYGYSVESFVSGGLLLTFMVLVNIALMNLLVGLAVSDVTALKKSARTRRIANQIDLLNVVEALSLQFVFRFLYLVICLKPRCCQCPSCWYCYLEPKPVIITPALSKDDLDSFELPLDLRKRVIHHVKHLRSSVKKKSE